MSAFAFQTVAAVLIVLFGSWMYKKWKISRKSVCLFLLCDVSVKHLYLNRNQLREACFAKHTGRKQQKNHSIDSVVNSKRSFAQIFRLPPVVKGHWLWGPNLELNQSTEQFRRWHKQYGDIFTVNLGGQTVVMVGLFGLDLFSFLSSERRII